MDPIGCVPFCFLVVGRGFLDGEEGILLYLKNTFTGVISTTAEHVGVCK